MTVAGIATVTNGVPVVLVWTHCLTGLHLELAQEQTTGLPSNLYLILLLSNSVTDQQWRMAFSRRVGRRKVAVDQFGLALRRFLINRQSRVHGLSVAGLSSRQAAQHSSFRI